MLTRLNLGLRNLLRLNHSPLPEQAHTLLAREDLRAMQAKYGSSLTAGSEYETGRDFFFIVSNSNVPVRVKFQCLLAKAMQRQGYTPVVINQDSHNEAEGYFRLFGVRHYVRWSQYLQDNVAPHHDLEAITNRLIPSTLDVQQIKALRYHQVQVGKYALASTCRSMKQGLVDFSSAEFRRQFHRHLRRAVGNVLGVEQLWTQFRPALLLTRDVGYVNNGPFLEMGVQRGTNSLVMARGQRQSCWILKRYTAENFSDHEFSVSRPTWERLRHQPYTPQMDRRVEAELQSRYQPDSRADLRRLQSNKQSYSPQEVRQLLQLDPQKKTAVIFAHVSWDGAFFFGEDLFADFDDWLVQTVRAACQNPHLNWIVKLHPLNVLKFAQEGKTDFEETEMVHLRKLMPLPEHVRIMRANTPINTASLFPVIDVGLTVRGTIGMELPCMGIPCLTAGTGRYEGRGFTIDSASREEYFTRLQQLHTLPPLSDEARGLARKHYYYLMIGRQFPFDDVAPMCINSQNETDSDMFDNIDLRAESVAEIWDRESIRQFSTWAMNPQELDLLYLPD